MEIQVLTFQVKEYIAKLEKGYIRIPIFQREYTWDENQVCKLLDSIYKGFPISTLILWESNNDIETNNSFFDYNFNITSDSNEFSVLLDGQQRSLSLFGCFKGVKTNNFDFKNFCINLDDLKFFDWDDSFFHYKENLEPSDISITTLLNEINEDKMLELVEEKLQDSSDDIKGSVLSRVLNIKKAINNYQLTFTRSSGVDLLFAPSIFEKINTAGKRLTQENIILSKLYINKSQNNPTFSFIRYLEDVKKSFSSFWGEGTFVSEETAIKIITQSITREQNMKNTKSINLERVIENNAKLLQAFRFSHRYLKDHFKVVDVLNTPKYETIYTALNIFYLESNGEHINTNTYNKLNHLLLGFCIIKDNASPNYTKLTEKRLFNNIERLARKQEVSFYSYFRPEESSILDIREGTHSLNACQILMDVFSENPSTSSQEKEIYPDVTFGKIYVPDSNMSLDDIFSNDTIIRDNCLQGIPREFFDGDNEEEFRKKRLENIIKKLIALVD